MKLSTNFSYEELTTSSHRGLDNTPNDVQLSNLKHTAWQMELVRHILGDRPIHINSGFRSEAVNAAVGGSKTSAHSLGHAVDFICPAFGTPIDIAHAIMNSGLKVDQLIYEISWIHISFDPRMRNQYLTAHFTPGKPTKYTNGV